MARKHEILSVRCPQHLLDEAEYYAKKSGVSRSKLICAAIRITLRQAKHRGGFIIPCFSTDRKGIMRRDSIYNGAED